MKVRVYKPNKQVLGGYIYVLFDRRFNNVIGWNEHRMSLVEFSEKTGVDALIIKVYKLK